MGRLEAFFEANDREAMRFESIPESRRKSGRRDLHAFLLLDGLCPGKAKMIAGAEHDQIWLDVPVGKIEKAATDDDLLDLIRCGVRYDGDQHMFAMFV